MSLEFKSKVLHLLKQKEFYPYEYLSDFGKLQEKLPKKEKLYSFLTDEMFLRFQINLKWKW